MGLSEEFPVCFVFVRLKKAKNELLQRNNRKHTDWNIESGMVCAGSRTERALQWAIKHAKNIIGTHLTSISDIGKELPVQS